MHLAHTVALSAPVKLNAGMSKLLHAASSTVNVCTTAVAESRESAKRISQSNAKG